MDRKSPSQIRREKIIRAGAILIVLALMLSLLAGAFSAAPAQAMARGDFEKSVQILEVSVEVNDTDGDGIENNEDPDIDGDGLVNGADDDIDGDGIDNFEDADPVDTTDIDSRAPTKPNRPTEMGDIIREPATLLFILPVIALVTLVSAILLTRRRKKGSKISS